MTIKKPLAFPARLAWLALAGAVVALSCQAAPAGSSRAPRPPRDGEASTATFLTDRPALAASGPPGANAVYRCGNTYSATPCAGAGTGTPPLDVDDPRTAAQRRQGQDVAAREKRLAAWLTAQRHEREGPLPSPLSKKTRAKAVKGCVPTVALACPDAKTSRPRRAAIPKKPASPARAGDGT
jgi:hypothetical protein